MGCCFQLPAGSLRLPHRSYRRSTDMVLSLYACFSLYLPWKSKARECGRFPCAFRGAAGGVGWRRAARIRPCHSLWEFSVHALKHLEAGAWWAGQVRAQGRWVLTRCSPKGEHQGCGHCTPKEARPVASSIPVDFGNPKDKDRALFCGRTCCCSFPPAFRRSQAAELPGWTNTIPTDTVRIQRKIQKIRHPNLPPCCSYGAGRERGRGCSALPGLSLLSGGLIALYTADFPIKPSKSPTFYYFCGFWGVLHGPTASFPPCPARRGRAGSGGGRHGNPGPPRPWRSRRTQR